MSNGELWTREVLEELRTGGYAPAAWRTFLSRSLRRAAETRKARPALLRQSQTWAIAGFASLGVGRPVLTRMGARPSLWAAAGWWTAVCVMVDWHLGMVERADGVVFRGLAPADALTLTRFWLVPFAACRQRRRSAFAGLVMVGAATDLLDGRLAAHAGPTRLGRDLDTTADISFFGAAAIGARRSGWLSRSAAVAATARSSAPVIVAAAHYFTEASRPPDRSGHTWSSVPFVAGLAITPIRPRVGNTLVALSCLGWLVERHGELWRC